MKILYLSCHEILEYDELRLLSDLGYDCFSLGSYTHPGGTENRKRPPLPNLPYDPHFIELSLRHNREAIHPEMLEDMDVVILMHVPEWLKSNWSVFKDFMARGGRVIWRSIGQSVPWIEQMLTSYRNEFIKHHGGLEIVRMSPFESTIFGYAGENATIRFYKDPADFRQWTGISRHPNRSLINFTQSLRSRGAACNFREWSRIYEKVPVTVFGPGNEDLGGCAGGLLSYEDQIHALSVARGYLYLGTHPAPYTLNFMEAWMSGCPVVALGRRFGNGNDFPQQKTYEVHDLITHGVDGYVSNDLDELVVALHLLLQNDAIAASIGAHGRQKAIEVFGRDTVAPQWKAYLG